MHENLNEKLNRSVKIAIDTGEAKTIQEAEQIFQGYCLAIEVGPNISTSPSLQAALLTVINTARRCFLGGVYVGGNIHGDLLIPWKTCHTLPEAIHDLHGAVTRNVPPEIPRIIIGDVGSPQGLGDFALRATFNGWSGGVIPLRDKKYLPERFDFTPSGVLAGALAVSEAFQYIRGNNPLAGRRDVGLSLWMPGSEVSWMDPNIAGPTIRWLPSNLWLIGLGHLGQAFLWTLGFLPYARPEDLLIVLQDFDILSDANDSTSPLTFGPVMKEKKSRAMAKWCEDRGFRTLLNERMFTKDFHVSGNDPRVGICGVDNAYARAALEDVGFERIIEAGLGKGTEEYLSFQIHTFPGPQKARDRWSTSMQRVDLSEMERKPAYKALAKDGMDDCGLTTLAGRSVGASFVGTMVSTLMIAEILRMAHGYHGYGLIDGTLRSLERMDVINNDEWSEIFNPGITDARMQV